MAILRAIHDMHGRNADALLMAVHEQLVNSAICMIILTKDILYKFEEIRVILIID